MAFPETRLTLIRRLASGGSEQDWHEFLADYWGPVCRFASFRAGLSLADAEDIASKTFEVILSNELLVRWSTTPSAKLRTLICSVVQKVLSNQTRVARNRKRLLKEYATSGEHNGPLIMSTTFDVADEQVDAFYAAWVEELLRQSVDSLLEELYGEGKGDYFRVLYGRLCDGMTMPQISQLLGIKTTDSENYFKAAKKRLATCLKDNVEAHVRRYNNDRDIESDFRAEWDQLGEFMRKCGGLEDAVRHAHLNAEERGNLNRTSGGFHDTLSKVSSKSDLPGE